VKSSPFSAITLHCEAPINPPNSLPYPNHNNNYTTRITTTIPATTTTTTTTTAISCEDGDAI
jgi:hypothetical protein